MTTVHAQTGIKLATKPAKTSLLGGHFIYKANTSTSGLTVPSANIVENVSDDPTTWGHNVHIGSSGIKLRIGETTLSEWVNNANKISLIFYRDGMSRGQQKSFKGIEIKESGLTIYSLINKVSLYPNSITGGVGIANGFDACSSTEFSYPYAQVTLDSERPIYLGVFDSTLKGSLYIDSISVKVRCGLQSDSNDAFKAVLMSAPDGVVLSEPIVISNSATPVYTFTLTEETATIKTYIDTLCICFFYDGEESSTKGKISGADVILEDTIPDNLEALQITGDGLKLFGNVSGIRKTALTVTAKGIKIEKGGLVFGTPGTNDFVYLSTNDYTTTYLQQSITINGHTDGFWRQIIGSNFGILNDGTVYAANANILGHIESSDGEIGGWTINTQSLSKGTIGSNGSAFLATANLAGTVAGQTLSGGTGYTGWRLTVGSNFGVDNTGKLYASGAEIGGKITATSGYIGGTTGFLIDSQQIRSYDKETSSATSYSITLSRKSFTRAINGTSRGALVFAIGNTFGVDYDGWLYASHAEISGTITATAGTIGGCSIESGVLKVTDANIKGTISANHIDTSSITVSKIQYDSSNYVQVNSGGVSVVSSYGNLLISSTGINLTTTGSGTKAIKFNSYPLLNTYRLKYKLNTSITPGKSWQIRQGLPNSVLTNYTVLGIVGYNFDKGDNTSSSSGGGISLFNPWECEIINGQTIHFSARNTAPTNGYTILKGIFLWIDLLVTPKLASYSPEEIDNGNSGSESDEN